MNPLQAPVTKDLVLVGGGHSHVGVLKGFATKPVPGVRLTLITRDIHTPYSGMLPGLIAGHYEFDETHIDLGPLSQFAGARLYHDEVVGLDLDARKILCRSRPPVPYDLVSINTGSTPTLDPVPGAAESVVPVKPIGNFLSRWAEVRERVLARAGTTRIGVVGAGAGGVELLLSVRHALETLRRESGPALSPSRVPSLFRVRNHPAHPQSLGPVQVPTGAPAPRNPTPSGIEGRPGPGPNPGVAGRVQP